MKITNTSVRKIDPPEKGYRIFYDEKLKGFGIRVTASDVRSYIAEDRVNGKTQRHTLGRHGAITADQARTKAKAKLGQMADGVDLAAEKARQKAEAVTLAEVAESYLKNRRALQPDRCQRRQRRRRGGSPRAGRVHRQAHRPDDHRL